MHSLCRHAVLMWCAVALAMLLSGCNDPPHEPVVDTRSAQAKASVQPKASTQPKTTSAVQAKADDRSKDKTPKLAIVSNSADGFWELAKVGIHKYEKEGEVDIDLQVPKAGTVVEQNEILENLLTQSYHGIAVNVIGTKEQKDILDRVAKSAKLITFNSDIPFSRREFYIGTNHYEVGKALALKIAKLLPKGAKMAVFLGQMSYDNDQQCYQGLKDMVGRYSIEIVERREDEGDPDKARANVEEVLKAHPDVKLVAGLSPHSGPAIAQALRALGKVGRVKAVAFDDHEETLKALQNGTIAATVVQDPFETGYLVSKWLHDLVTKPKSQLKGFPEKKTSPLLLAPQVYRNGIWTPIEVLEPDKLAAFKSERAEKLK